MTSQISWLELADTEDDTGMIILATFYTVDTILLLHVIPKQEPQSVPRSGI